MSTAMDDISRAKRILDEKLDFGELQKVLIHICKALDALNEEVDHLIEKTKYL